MIVFHCSFWTSGQACACGGLCTSSLWHSLVQSCSRMQPTLQGNDQQATPTCHRPPARIMLWEVRMRPGMQSSVSRTTSTRCKMGSRMNELSSLYLHQWWESAHILLGKIGGARLCSRLSTGLTNMSGAPHCVSKAHPGVREREVVGILPNRPVLERAAQLLSEPARCPLLSAK